LINFKIRRRRNIGLLNFDRALAADLSGGDILRKVNKAGAGLFGLRDLKALRTISVTISGSRICVAYFVIGSNMLTKSKTW